MVTWFKFWTDIIASRGVKCLNWNSENALLFVQNGPKKKTKGNFFFHLLWVYQFACCLWPIHASDAAASFVYYAHTVDVLSLHLYARSATNILNKWFPSPEPCAPSNDRSIFWYCSQAADFVQQPWTLSNRMDTEVPRTQYDLNGNGQWCSVAMRTCGHSSRIWMAFPPPHVTFPCVDSATVHFGTLTTRESWKSQNKC